IWKETFTLIDNPYDLINPDDEFIWPYVQIGPSPVPDKRRVYVYANNSAFNTPSGNPCGNILIAYADFETADLDAESELEWTYQTIPLLDQWHNEDPWIRPFLAMAVSDDGKIAFVGWNTEDEIFVFLNENYGEDGFDYYSEDYKIYVDNPFPDDPHDYYFTFNNCTHFNAIFTEDNNNICFEGTMGLHGEDPNGGDDIYFPYYIYPKVFSFDLFLEEFCFFDLYPQGANPNDEILMLPWDLNEDGIPDSVDEDGNVIPVQGWPIYYYDNEMAYNVNYFYIAKNDEKNWLAAVWSDGLKSKYANAGEDEYFDWLEVPEIAISISNNNGETWSEPIFLNSLETPELAEMIPCYIYPGDLIEDLGNEHGKLHLFFLDDYNYSHGGGWFNGNGMLKYTALDIDFGYNVAVDENDISSAELVLQSYPNPFHSETTISFNVTQTSRFVTLEIFNIKGQRIRELEIINDKLEMNKVIWDGTDDNGKLLSSGIYLIKFKSDKNVISKKITLIR
ncbi:MAG TPA: T9SS type A sorting domain-containing protein, partial [Candidatus Cloacimonetes bacterium]|nr:T9SS type A sorting domain-containing protein [Candidatus Cloacimonadota bacterium]